MFAGMRIFLSFCHLSFDHECRCGREATATILECKSAFEVIGSPIGSVGETCATKKSLAHQIHRKRIQNEGHKGLETEKELQNIFKFVITCLSFVKTKMLGTQRTLEKT